MAIEMHDATETAVNLYRADPPSHDDALAFTKITRVYNDSRRGPLMRADGTFVDVRSSQ
jgi:hypothetical protein